MKSRAEEESSLFSDYSVYNEDGQEETNMLNALYVFPFILIITTQGRFDGHLIFTQTELREIK